MTSHAHVMALWMKVLVDPELCDGKSGPLIHAAACSAGWKHAGRGEFVLENAQGGILELWAIPALQERTMVVARCRGLHPPSDSVLDDLSLLDGEEGNSLCPQGTTLVAGDLLALPGEAPDQLYGRILDDWDWWMRLRADSRELAVCWRDRPDNNLLLLFDRLDAGYLDESLPRVLAANRASLIVGWHPSARPFGRAAGIPMTGADESSASFVVSGSSLHKGAFWDRLGKETEA